MPYNSLFCMNDDALLIISILYLQLQYLQGSGNTIFRNLPAKKLLSIF